MVYARCKNLRRSLCVASCDLVQHFRRIIKAALQTLKVEHGHTAMPANFDREMRINHRVHCRCQDWNLQVLTGQHRRYIRQLGN